MRGVYTHQTHSPNSHIPTMKNQKTSMKKKSVFIYRMEDFNTLEGGCSDNEEITQSHCRPIRPFPLAHKEVFKFTESRTKVSTPVKMEAGTKKVKEDKDTNQEKFINEVLSLTDARPIDGVCEAQAGNLKSKYEAQPCRISKQKEEINPRGKRQQDEIWSSGDERGDKQEEWSSGRGQGRLRRTSRNKRQEIIKRYNRPEKVTFPTPIDTAEFYLRLNGPEFRMLSQKYSGKNETHLEAKQFQKEIVEPASPPNTKINEPPRRKRKMSRSNMSHSVFYEDESASKSSVEVEPILKKEYDFCEGQNNEAEAVQQPLHNDPFYINELGFAEGREDAENPDESVLGLRGILNDQVGYLPSYNQEGSPLFFD